LRTSATIALATLRDNATAAAEEGEEELASWLQEAEPFLDPDVDVVSQAEILGMITNKR
jgi:hypothetical protein